MRKTFTYLSLLMAFMFAGAMSSWAQFKAEITTDPVEGYTVGYVNFDPAELAAAIGVDVADIKTAVTTSGTYYIQTEDGRSNDYMGDNNQFWMNNDGYPRSYSSGEATWFSGIIWNEAGSDETSGETWSDSVYISFGQMPNTFKYVYEASVLKATTYLVVGDKEITFEVIQNVNPAPVPTLPDPVTKLSALTIVGEWTVEIPFILGKSYEGYTYTGTLEGIYEKLGVSSAELDPFVADNVFSQTIKVDSLKTDDGIETGEVIYSFVDSLVAPSTTDGWYGRYINYDEASAIETPLEYNAPMGWSSPCTFYTQAITLTEGEYSFRGGQMPGAFTSLDDADYTYHYIVVGDKAAKIKIQVKMEEPASRPLTEMTEVGSEDIEIKHYLGGSGSNFSLDMTAIAELLGTEAINFEVLSDPTTLSDNTTANNGGYWLSKEGYPVSWSGDGSTGNAIYVEPSTSGDFSTLNYGFNDGAWTLGDKTTIKLYFHNGTQYYLVNLNVEIIEQPQIGEDQYELVSTEGIHFQIIPSNEYWTEDYMTTDLDIDYLASLLGEGSYKLYGMSAPDADGKSTMTDAYSCTPYPGFWMTADAPECYVGVWGTNAFGMTYASGVITWYQFPGQRAAGDVYNATFFLVNESNNKMVKLATVIEYVETIVETAVVGEEDLTLVVASGDEPLYTPVDFTVVADSFGVEIDILEVAAEIKTLKTPTSFTADNYDSSYGWFLNESGCCTDLLDEEACMNAPVTLGYEWYNTETAPFSFFTTAGVMAEAPADGVTYRTKIAVEYDAKQYIYHITMMNEADATGIEKVEATTVKTGNVYDLSGRIVRKNANGVNGLANGVYILNGKKYIVK